LLSGTLAVDYWFEKQPDGRSPGGGTSVEVCAHGGIVVTDALVCERQRLPQFPLRPYT
jgi:hypothetical protein